MTANLRSRIRAEVTSIQPLDELEQATRTSVLNWIDSDAQLCRVKKPAIPDKHLVSYFPLIDGDHILLVDHINAQLWLPNGGHVEPGEHPKQTAAREVKEELGIDPQFLVDSPIFLTCTETVGHTAGHTDVSLWYVLRGDRRDTLSFDESEFSAARWFHRDEVPFDKTDPELHRFMQKLPSVT